MITTAATGLGSPCPSGHHSAGALPPWAQAVIAVGVVLCVTLVAVVAVVVAQRRRQGSPTVDGELLAANHPDMVRVQDSVMVAKKRKDGHSPALPKAASFAKHDGECWLRKGGAGRGGGGA
jgi:negative regulator of sigma E activity